MSVYFSFLILTIIGGVFSDDGSCVTKPSCPKNEHYTVNSTRCVRTCANREEPICDDCKPITGCECDEGLVRVNIDGTGKCVPESQCQCKGDDYAVLSQFPSPCQPTCDNINPQTCVTTEMQLPPGCVCIKGYVKAKNGKCIKPENCPEGCNGDPKARYSDCPSLCPLTCEEPLPRPCVAICAPPGCVCNPGYFLTKDGRCVELKDCPGGCNGDPKARYSDCPSLCPLTCEEPLPRPCVALCAPPACVCNDGYFLTKDGRCVELKDCPGGCNGDPKATFSDCPSLCPLTCEEPLPRPCVDMCAPAGCVCNDGYVLSPGGKCIDPKNCPALEKK